MIKIFNNRSTAKQKRRVLMKLVFYSLLKLDTAKSSKRWRCLPSHSNIVHWNGFVLSCRILWSHGIFTASLQKMDTDWEGSSSRRVRCTVTVKYSPCRTSIYHCSHNAESVEWCPCQWNSCLNEETNKFSVRAQCHCGA